MSKRIRRLAIFGVLAFVAVSTLLHFAVGSTVTTLFPNWRSDTPPDQAVSIISLSRHVREEPTSAPTTPPSPPPKIIARTSIHMAPLRYLEVALTNAVRGSIRPPARRKSNLFISGPSRPRPGKLDAPAASNSVEPTPAPGSAGAKVDTGGKNDELNGTTVWGDDNPPRIVRLEPVALSVPPPQPVRIEVQVGPDGNVTGATIAQSSGDAKLDELALEAARKTVFAPATLNGLPVHGRIILEYPPPATGST